MADPPKIAAVILDTIAGHSYYWRTDLLADFVQSVYIAFSSLCWEIIKHSLLTRVFPYVETHPGGLPVARAFKAHVFPHDHGRRGDLVEWYVLPQQDGSYGRGEVRHQVPPEGRHTRPDRSEWNGT